MEAASLSDAQAVVALWHVCGLTRPWNDPHADFRRAIDGPSSTVLVAREDGAVIASVMIGHDGHRGWVYYLAVSPDRRGQGLGAAAMRVAESWLSSHGIPKIQLMVREDNATATAFYHRLGYARQAVAVLGRFLESQGMTILYGIPNCDTVKRARRWLDENGVPHQFHDYRKLGMDEARLRGWANRLGWEKLLNRAGTTFRKLPEEQKQDLDEDKAIAIMLANTSAIKRPVVEQEDKLLVGFDLASFEPLKG